MATHVERSPEPTPGRTTATFNPTKLNPRFEEGERRGTPKPHSGSGMSAGLEELTEEPIPSTKEDYAARRPFWEFVEARRAQARSSGRKGARSRNR